MIYKDSPVTKEFVYKIYQATKNKNYCACCLSSIQNENNMKEIIRFIDDNPKITISEIEERIMVLTGVLN